MIRQNKIRALLILLMGLICAIPALAAESTAVADPIQLTLRVHKTTLKILDEVETRLDSDSVMKIVDGLPRGGTDVSGIDWNKVDMTAMEKKIKDSERVIRSKRSESIWVQIEIVNIGSGPVVVTDAIFDERSNFGGSLKFNIERYFGAFITVIGPDGKKVEWTEEPAPLYGCGNHNEFVERPLVGEEKRRVSAIIKSGHDAGLTAEQMQKRLDAYSAEKNDRERNAQATVRYARLRKRLAPGQSLTSSSWTYGGVCGRRNPMPMPVAGFAELWNFKLTKPGRYRIRAVYDMRQTPSGGLSKRELHSLGAVRVSVPEIIVEVKP